VGLHRRRDGAAHASERSLGTILREDICAPLGIDFQIGTPESEHASRVGNEEADARRVISARSRQRARRRSSPSGRRLCAVRRQWRKIEIPAANGHGTALAVARLYEAYATGGYDQWQRACSRRKPSTR
jgi:CubicO group peptidase (beta-lactamase class C family)